MSDNPQDAAKASAPSLLRIVIADDHEFVRHGLKSLVNGQPGMSIVGEAHNGKQLEEVIAHLAAQNRTPDVAIIDVSMPDGGGLEATRKIRQRFPKVQVLILSLYEDRLYLRATLNQGALGYLSKRSPPDAIIHALRMVASGKPYIDPALTSTLTSAAFWPASGAPGETIAADLSDTEEVILRLTAQGYMNKEVAAQLGMNQKTMEGCKTRAMSKLNLHTLSELVRYAVTRGWLTK